MAEGFFTGDEMPASSRMALALMQNGGAYDPRQANAGIADAGNSLSRAFIANILKSKEAMALPTSGPMPSSVFGDIERKSIPAPTSFLSGLFSLGGKS